MNGLYATMLICDKLNGFEIGMMKDAMTPASATTIDMIEGEDYKIDPFEISWPLVTVAILSIVTSTIAVGSFMWLAYR